VISRVQNFFGFKSKKPVGFYLSFSLAVLILVIFATTLIATSANSNPMPQLAGLTTDEVSVIAQEHQLEIQYLWVNSNAPKGEVTMQDPEAGSSFAPGSKIKVFLSKGNSAEPSNPSKPQNAVTPATPESNNQKNGTAPGTKNQSPNSVKNPPTQTTPKKASPPDPTRPWLTQEQIDANVAQRAEIVGRFNSQLAYVQSLQAARDAKRAEQSALCNPPVREGYDFGPCLAVGPVIDQMTADIDGQIAVLESINAELQNGTWY
jgi:hypothetical protein